MREEKELHFVRLSEEEVTEILTSAYDMYLTICAVENRLAEKNPPPRPETEMTCSTHPDAPHGFLRIASHTAGRYVCKCEGWEPAIRKPLTEAEIDEELETNEYYCAKSFADGVRFAEKHHGIGEHGA